MILFRFFPMQPMIWEAFKFHALRFPLSSSIIARKFGLGRYFMEQNWNKGPPDAICGKPRDERVAAPASV
jgi:hypothetical protein